MLAEARETLETAIDAEWVHGGPALVPRGGAVLLQLEHVVEEVLRVADLEVVLLVEALDQVPQEVRVELL